MDILNEYLTVSNELTKLKEQVFDVRNNFKREIDLAETNDEKKRLFDDYVKNLDAIKDDQFVKKYKLLKERRNEIIKRVTKSGTDVNSDQLTSIIMADLLAKYESDTVINDQINLNKSKKLKKIKIHLN